MSSSIPHPAELTPAFVTACLREAGHAAVEVRSLHGTRIGTGQTGQCFRYELELAGGAPGAPRTLVAKGPSDDPTSRRTGVKLRNYKKEVSFYRRLRGRLGIRTPRCYYAAIEGEGPEHLLVLEDAAPAVPGDQLAGCSAAVAHAAVQALVGLHAPTWNDATLLACDWLGAPSGATVQLGRALYRAQLPAFLDRFAPRLEPDEIAVIERVATSEGPPFELLGDAFSVVHVDYRLDNLLIDEAATPPGITAVDWQSCMVGAPLADVAYFLGAGLLPPERRSAEREIVGDYHEALVKAGVCGYEAERCWEDYRRSVFSGFAVTVIAASMVQQTGRGDEMFAAMARRHARHAIDLGSVEFLG
jgi:hypothetical protein